MNKLEQIYMLLACATLLNALLLCAVSAKKQCVNSKLKALDKNNLEIAREYEKLAQFISEIEEWYEKHYNQ